MSGNRRFNFHDRATREILQDPEPQPQKQGNAIMKVKKFNSVSAPDYPSHRQFAECKALMGAVVIGLGCTVLAAPAPVAPGGTPAMSPRQEAPARPSVQTPAAPINGRLAGVIRAEPQPIVNQPRLGGVPPVNPPSVPTPMPAPTPAPTPTPAPAPTPDPTPAK
jgi:hypothetical protein